jgi:hypothetical protein
MGGMMTLLNGTGHIRAYSNCKPRITAENAALNGQAVFRADGFDPWREP